MAHPVILATWEAETGKSIVQSQPRQIAHETPISKITRVKWTEDVAKAVECLLCKHKALSSNPCLAKKKKKQQNVTLTTYVPWLARLPFWTLASSTVQWG
jgi:Zn ribbon nucleic-acid-binding protein